MQITIRNRLMLSIGGLLLLLFCIQVLIDYEQQKHHLLTESIKDAEIINGMMMATRRVFHKQFLESGIELTRKTVGFLPAHAMNHISAEFLNFNSSGLTFNNISDRPRNPSQQADQVEMEAIDFFRKNPDQQQHTSSHIDNAGKEFFHYTRPIYIEAYCLDCHGLKDDAPEPIKSIYNTGYNYREGELRGLVSIKIPLDAINEGVWEHMQERILFIFLGYLLIFSLLFLLLRKTVFLRLEQLAEGVGQLENGGGLNTIPVNHQNSDEIELVALAINKMASRVAERTQHLRQSEESMQSVIQSLVEGLVIVTLDGKIELINKVACELFAVTPEEAQSATLDQLIPELQRQDHRLGFQRYRTSGYKQTLEHGWFEVKYEREGAPLRYLEISVKEIFLNDLPMFLGLIRDITSRKSDDRQRHEQEALRHSLLMSVGEGIVGVGLSGECTFVNRKAMDLLGYRDQQQLIGKEFHALAHHSYADGTPYPREKCPMNQLINSKHPIGQTISEEALWRSDRTSFPTRYHIEPVIHGNQLQAIVVSFSDMSEQLNIESKLKSQVTDLERFNQLAVGRELQMVELKQEINALLENNGYPARYPAAEIHRELEP